jgi:hypothetical protein
MNHDGDQKPEAVTKYVIPHGTCDPFDHPHDATYADGKQRPVFLMPADYLFAEAEDGCLIPMGVCQGDGLSDEELDKIADEKVIAYEQRKVTRSGSQISTNQADEPFDVDAIKKHMEGDDVRDP